MKTYSAAARLLFVLLILFVPLAALCGSAVPQAVLSARSGLVRIYCEKTNGTIACGTGFAVGKDEPVKYIVTNHHVAEDTASITVLCAQALKVNASVYLENESADLCVLKLSTQVYGLKPLTIEDTENANVGDAIYALGFPAASDAISIDVDASPEDVTVTDGIISAVKTAQLKENGTAVTLMQINASMSGGNSGGPLIDEDGRVVGVNTLAVTEAQDINAAVSAKALAAMMDAAGIDYKSASDDNALHTTAIIVMIVTGVFVIAVGIVCLVTLRKRKPLKFDGYFFSSEISDEEKLFALLPVVKQVAALHRKGRYGFDICPENIVVSRGVAVLRVRNVRLDAAGLNVMRPGYSAPERYTGGMAGPWSDIYSVCALVYAAIKKQTPPLSFESEGQEVQLEKDDALGEIIMQGMAKDIMQRPPMLDAVSAQIQQCLVGYMPTAQTKNVNEQKTVPTVEKVHTDRHTKRVNKAAVVCVAALLLLGGTMLVNEINYSQAIEHVEAGEYAQAQRSIKGVFSFYADTMRLTRYADAGVKLENGEYDAASRIFSELGSYRNSADMVLETDYRHAQYLIQVGRYAEAGEYLDAVGAYRDTALLRAEIDYQNGCTYFEAGLYFSALDAFIAAGSYNDSVERIEDVKSYLYVAAQNALTTGDMDTAAQCFAALPGYQQSDVYAQLATLLLRIQNSDSLTRDEYTTLLSFEGTIDLSPYLTSDALIAYYLCGRWKDERGNLFEMDENGGIKYNVPGEGGEYAFDDAVMYIEQGGSNEPVFGFSCIDVNTLELYCYENDETYVMTRQID